MAATNDPTIALGPDFKKLSGPENFTDWFQRFKDIAKIHGYAEYFKDNAEVVAKPIAPAFLALQQDDDDVVQEAPPVDWQYQVAVYQFQLQKWKDYDHASGSALALLHAAIEPSVWKEARDTNSPASALKAVISYINYETPNEVLSNRARVVIGSLKLDTSTAVRQFVVDFEELYGDVYFETDTSIWAIEKINEALPYGYRTYVKNWKDHINGMPITSRIFKMYRSRLLSHVEEDDPPTMNGKVRKFSRLR
ncbi:uncharacterized protein J4E84_005724 [Alternaria hordeiaustralica]|uniref:uncharacterized protein n=1 Tax=Alternaria hordeiaustralica TaxID=1187925 RepID=UPI0020C38480|nr:uncharacterized protein J4E84_005724 [Alternaria hordeiaustralica]KAI4686445.1 hypothetical protein J4E84_005724 [Alternaria hordeiaustralica]